MYRLKNRKDWLLIICFLTPMFIMACYFAYRNMSPFGNQSILTVDLGQQYVDFLANFKHTLLHDPSGILYSFSKAYGGEMFGTWAYYLASPVNLILLFFPLRDLPAAILFIILIKYGLAGLSFGYLLTRTVRTNPYLTIMWSTVYALNGWIIANQLNVMWLDGMVWLPVVILGINQIFSEHRHGTYLAGLTLAIITNYYMGYMIMLFSIVYAVFKLCTANPRLINHTRVTLTLIKQTLLSLGLSAWLILPTWFDLSQGKARYTRPHFRSRFEYSPVKMVAKLFNGSLNFNQLPHGTPNVFIGSAALIGALLYFCYRGIPLKKRLGALGVTLILLTSMCYEPLDLIWHGGQFPIWYPYRFSFIFCFWMIWLAANVISQRYSVNWIPTSIITGLLASLIIYVFVNRTRFPFVSPLNFVLGTGFLTINFILILYTHNGSRTFSIALMILSIIEMGLNSFNSLNNLTYISNESYTRYTQTLSDRINHIRQQNPIRIGKTFYRSKDDSFSNHFSSGDVFDSSLEVSTPRFMKQIGQPENQSFVTYANGTLLSDRLLGYRNYLTDPDHSLKMLSFRPDLSNYRLISSARHVKIYRNSSALPEVFTTYSSAFHVKRTWNPIQNQNRWYRNVTHQRQDLLKPARFTNYRSKGLIIHDHVLKQESPLQNGQVSMGFKPRKNNAYYLLIGPDLNRHTARLLDNGHQSLPGSTYSHPVILNLTSGKNSSFVNLKLKILSPKINDRPFKLYRLNARRFMNENDPAYARITAHNDHQLMGRIHTTKLRSVLGTSVPDTRGWHLTVDGKPKAIHKIANEFIGAALTPGKHTFKLTYRPPELTTGLLISLLTVIIIITTHYLKINKNA